MRGALLLAGAVFATGCFGSVSRDIAPLRGISLSPEVCPDLSGVYDNAARRSVPPKEASPSHLAAYFAAVDDPAAFQRVTVSRAAPGELAFALAAADREPVRIVLREGTDYSCDGRSWLLDRGAQVRRRDAGAIRLGRTEDGCLVAQTRWREGVYFLLALPSDEISTRWSVYCPPEEWEP